MSILQSPKRLAKLLASINVSYSERPISPIQVAEEIGELLKELNGDKNELKKRLPLSQGIIDGFLRLLNLPGKIQDIIVWGESNKNTGEISFSAASYICKLENSEDVLKLVGAMHDLDRPITKEEIKDIISLKKHNSGKPIENCINEVLGVTRPTVIQHFLFISGIDPSIVNELKAESQKNNMKLDDCGINVLSKLFPSGSLKGVKIHDDYLQLHLSEDGRNFMRRYGDSNNISRKDIINHMFEKGATGNEQQ